MQKKILWVLLVVSVIFFTALPEFTIATSEMNIESFGDSSDFTHLFNDFFLPYAKREKPIVWEDMRNALEEEGYVVIVDEGTFAAYDLDKAGAYIGGDLGVEDNAVEDSIGKNPVPGNISVLSTLGYYVGSSRDKGAFVRFRSSGDTYFINVTYNNQEDQVSSFDDIIRYFTAYGTEESNIEVVIDGKKFAFDVQPRIVKDRILLPLRVIFEEMGATVEWNNETQAVIAKKGNLEIIMTIDDPMVRVSDSSLVYGSPYGILLDQPAIIVDGRALAPLRFAAEVFGGTAIWDGATQTATITRDIAEAESPEAVRQSLNQSSEEFLLRWEYIYGDDGILAETLYAFPNGEIRPYSPDEYILWFDGEFTTQKVYELPTGLYDMELWIPIRLYPGLKSVAQSRTQEIDGEIYVEMVEAARALGMNASTIVGQKGLHTLDDVYPNYDLDSLGHERPFAFAVNPILHIGYEKPRGEKPHDYETVLTKLKDRMNQSYAALEQRLEKNDYHALQLTRLRERINTIDFVTQLDHYYVFAGPYNMLWDTTTENVYFYTFAHGVGALRRADFSNPELFATMYFTD